MENNISKNKNLRRKRLIKGEHIFIILMLAYPILHFLVMWIGVNINSILLVFKTPVRGKLDWVPLENLFLNFEILFDSFKQDATKSLFQASGVYFIIS